MIESTKGPSTSTSYLTRYGDKRAFTWHVVRLHRVLHKAIVNGLDSIAVKRPDGRDETLNDERILDVYNACSEHLAPTRLGLGPIYRPCPRVNKRRNRRRSRRH